VPTVAQGAGSNQAVAPVCGRYRHVTSLDTQVIVVATLDDDAVRALSQAVVVLRDYLANLQR
jgi:hypothetical protein